MTGEKKRGVLGETGQHLDFRHNKGGKKKRREACIFCIELPVVRERKGKLIFVFDVSNTD